MKGPLAGAKELSLSWYCTLVSTTARDATSADAVLGRPVLAVALLQLRMNVLRSTTSGPASLASRRHDAQPPDTSEFGISRREAVRSCLLRLAMAHRLTPYSVAPSSL